MEFLRKTQAWLVLATVTSGTASAFGAGTSRAFRRPRYTRKQTGCRDAMLSYRFFKFAIPTGFCLSLPPGRCDDKASKPCRHLALAPQLVQAKAPMIMKASLTRRRLSPRSLPVWDPSLQGARCQEFQQSSPGGRARRQDFRKPHIFKKLWPRTMVFLAGTPSRGRWTGTSVRSDNPT